MKIELAHRIRELPPYLFAAIDALKKEQRKQGKDLIDLGIGDPDLPTPPHIVAALAEAAARSGHHRYPSYVGHGGLPRGGRGLHADALRRHVRPGRARCIGVIGSKEAIAHFPFAFVEPGRRRARAPTPAIRSTRRWTRFAGGEPYYMPLRRENGFLPDLDAIPADVAKRAKIIWINYPNNPTAALAAPGFYEKVVAFAQKHDVIVASDLAYSEMYYERAAAVVPRDAGRARGRHRVPLAVEDLQHDRLAHRLGRAATRRWSAGSARSRPTSTPAPSRPSSAAAIAALTGDQACVARAARDLPRAARRPVRRPRQGGLRRADAQGQLLHAGRATRKGMTSIEFAVAPARPRRASSRRRRPASAPAARATSASPSARTRRASRRPSPASRP